MLVLTVKEFFLASVEHREKTSFSQGLKMLSKVSFYEVP
jgi:hypothetical protein